MGTAFWLGFSLGIPVGLVASVMADRVVHWLKSVAAHRIEQTITISPDAQRWRFAEGDSYLLQVVVPKKGLLAALFDDVEVPVITEVIVESCDHHQPVIRLSGYWLVGRELAPVINLGFGFTGLFQLASYLGFAGEAQGLECGRYNVEARVLDARGRRLCALWMGHVTVSNDGGRDYTVNVTKGLVNRRA